MGVTEPYMGGYVRARTKVGHENLLRKHDFQITRGYRMPRPNPDLLTSELRNWKMSKSIISIKAFLYT